MRPSPLLLLAVTACAGEPERRESVHESTDPDAAVALLAAIEGWEEFLPVDAPLRFGPEDCMIPPGPVLRRSEAGGRAGHARKLYTLRAKDPESYRFALGTAPVGQVLVKQTFVPRELRADEDPGPPPLGGSEVYPFAAWDGRVWTAEVPGPLFVMAKLDPDTPGTDEGWIYGGVSPEGEVLTAGLVADCMACHRSDATTDRQFGSVRVDWSTQPVEEVALAQTGVDPEWIRRAKLASYDYRQWHRVDDEAHWAPFLCRMPRPPRARRSESADGETHGRKLYSLFAKDRAAYVDAEIERAPEGQVLVKEAWIPERVDRTKLPEGYPSGNPVHLYEAMVDGWVPFAVDEEGRAWRAAELGPLFLMMKLGAQVEGTDEGWIYATVRPDGVVTACGEIASCIECHREAPRDRQFGLPPD